MPKPEARESQGKPEIPQGVSIKHLDIKTDKKAVALLYQQVFAGPPWDETSSTDEIEKLVEEAKKKPDATMFVAKSEDRIIGFTWGYSIPNKEAFFQYKSHYSKDALAVWRGAIEEKQHNITWPIYYFAEIGISEEARGQGISKLLTAKHIEKATELGQPMLMTTDWRTQMVPVVEKLGMQLILGRRSRYDKAKGQMVLTGEVANYIDPQSPDRVLFLLPKREIHQRVSLRR